MNDTLKVAGRIGAELGAAKAENEKLRGLLHGAHDTIRNLAEDLDEEEFQATIDQLAEIELALAQQQAEPECRCTLRERMVGDGCSVCNPELAAELAADIEDDEPAPAQDEREAPIVVATALLGGMFHGGSGPELGEIDIEVCTPALEKIQCETVDSSDDVFLPLMTVAQHERIVAALTRPAQIEQQPLAWLIDWPEEPELGHYFSDEPNEHARSRPLYAAPIAQTAPQGKFRMGEPVRKISGSQWKGKVVGTYSTELTPEGYCVESSAEKGSVQIYPAKALEAVE